MNKMAGVLAALTVACYSSNCFAQDKSPSSEDQIKQLAELGPGVHKIKKDESGRMQSCVIVGSSRMSTVLGTAKGLETARKRATLSARAEFVRWMKTAVVAVQSMSDESIVYLQGSGGAVSESGKGTEVTKDNVDTLSAGLVRGMTVIGFNQDPKSEMLTVVYGWSPKFASMAQDAEMTNIDPSSHPSQSVSPNTESSSGPSKAPIPAKTVTSDSAGEFLK